MSDGVDGYRGFSAAIFDARLDDETQCHSVSNIGSLWYSAIAYHPSIKKTREGETGRAEGEGG
jgi:hypothetical protein